MKHAKLVLLGVTGLVAASVAGCSSTGGYQTAEYRPSRGSTIELTQTLQLPSGGTRTYIQDGRSAAWSELDLWTPYCSFGLNASRDRKPLVHEIHPTAFTTGDTRLGLYAALDPNAPPSVDPDSIFARRGIQVAGESANASAYTLYTTITLYSDQEPQVEDLTCAVKGLSTDRNLTLAQMQATLGSIVKIQ